MTQGQIRCEINRFESIRMRPIEALAGKLSGVFLVANVDQGNRSIRVCQRVTRIEGNRLRVGGYGMLRPLDSDSGSSAVVLPAAQVRIERRRVVGPTELDLFSDVAEPGSP